MSSLTHFQSHRVDPLHPAAAALAGAMSFAVSLTAADALGLGGDAPDASATTVTDVLAYAGLVVAGVVLAVLLGIRARAGAPDRLARYALGLAIGSAVTFVVFWTGWPHVLGAVAIALALEHRRRIGGFTALSRSAVALGALTLSSSIVVCLVG
jgi:hypothetical protein